MINRSVVHIVLLFTHGHVWLDGWNTSNTNWEQKDVLLATMSSAVEKFELEEIESFKELKKLWAKARLEYDAAKAKLDETLKTKQQGEPDALRYLRAHLHYIQARKREALRFEAALDKVGDVLWKRDFSLLQETVICMQALSKFLDSSYQTLAQLEEYLGQLKAHSAQRREEWMAFKAQKKDERAKRQMEEYAARYTPLVELLSNEDLALVNAVCVTAGAEQDVVLESLIHILDAHKMTLPIIKLGITREIEKTKSAATLFRGNTMATKLMTAFTKMTGRQYLSDTLKPLLEDLSSRMSSGLSFEIDPEKQGEDHAANMENLRKTCQAFLDSIVGSIRVCPVPFRIMAAHLRDEVVRSYPEAKYISVGGFIFLRFFCPAILSPDSMNPPLLPTVDAKVRRGLILLSKCLQNLANGIEFGVKEPHLVPMNSFVSSNDAKVKQFFDELASSPSNEEYEPLCSIETAIAKELPNLHTKIVQNLSKIGTSLTQYKQEDTIPALCLILAELTEDGLSIPVTDKKKDKKDKK